MARGRRLIAGVLAIGATCALMSGCAAIREFVESAPLEGVGPTLAPLPEPYEKIYSGGSRPEGLSQEQWEKKATRRIMAAAAVDRIPVYSVTAEEGSDSLTIVIKGDPTDEQLLADIERGVVPVALRWSPLVTIRVDPSVCGIVAEIKPDSALCDDIANRLRDN